MNMLGRAAAIWFAVGCGGHEPATKSAPVDHATPVALTDAAPDGQPSADACRKALVNALGLLAIPDAPSDTEVRLCTKGSTAKAVECAMSAASSAALEQCEFMRRARP